LRIEQVSCLTASATSARRSAELERLAEQLAPAPTLQRDFRTPEPGQDSVADGRRESSQPRE